MKHKVVCSGIAVLDRVYSFEKLPLTPGKHLARGYRENGGGMAATAAISIVALGATASWYGRLGDDATGETLLGMLRRLGVQVDGAIVAPGAQSPSAGVTLDAEGERVLCVYPGANLPEDARIPPDALDGAGAVLADPRWVGGAEQVFAMARARGLPSVLDAELGPSHILQRLAPQAGHAIFSERGLVDFTGIADPQAGLAHAATVLSGVVAVTLGARGSLWWQRERIVAMPAPRIVARDTTGCGDVFHGAYALALAEGADILPAARFATAAAALKAANGNGWEGMPDRTAVAALLREDW
jgi:sulfofructose kinase